MKRYAAALVFPDAHGFVVEQVPCKSFDEAFTECRVARDYNAPVYAAVVHRTDPRELDQHPRHFA